MGLKGWEKNPKIVKADLEQNGGRKKFVHPSGRTIDATGLINAVMKDSERGPRFCDNIKVEKPRYTYDGNTFRNKAEYDRWLFLKDRERRGEIRNLRYEKLTFVIIDNSISTGRASRYTPDFTYEECSNGLKFGKKEEEYSFLGNWRNVAEDVKPDMTGKKGVPHSLKTWKFKAELFRLQWKEWELREVVV